LIEKEMPSGRTVVEMLEMIRENEPLDGQISIFEGERSRTYEQTD
jgi:hypothetical protein